MKLNELGTIQFANTFYPGDAMAAEEQGRAHSHAARAAHAKARRLRTIEYQARKASQIPEDHQGVKERSIAPSSSVQPILNAVETEQPLLPSPVSLLASDRRDPFKSFARSFESIEHFLLDHCKSLLHLHGYYRRETYLLLMYLTHDYITVWLT
jgi:hypothetical protein